MTNEEAIKSLQNIIEYWTCKPSEVEAAKLAIQALEKQMPKKLDYEADGYGANGELLYDTAYCPNCNRLFEVYYDNDKEFCPNCGQALDFGGE